MDVPRPNPADFGPFAKYLALPPEGDIQGFLETQLTDLQSLLSDLPEPESLIHHPPYTWSIRQVVGHITDCERVFGYRALWLARGGQSPLASFDENEFMRTCNFDRWPLAELLAEFSSLRRSHILFYRHLESAAWSRHGTVSQYSMSPATLIYVTAGHAQHHLNILHKRLARQ